MNKEVAEMFREIRETMAPECKFEFITPSEYNRGGYYRFIIIGLYRNSHRGFGIRVNRDNYSNSYAAAGKAVAA